MTAASPGSRLATLGCCPAPLVRAWPSRGSTGASLGHPRACRGSGRAGLAVEGTRLGPELLAIPRTRSPRSQADERRTRAGGPASRRRSARRRPDEPQNPGPFARARTDEPCRQAHEGRARTDEGRRGDGEPCRCTTEPRSRVGEPSRCTGERRRPAGGPTGARARAKKTRRRDKPLHGRAGRMGGQGPATLGTWWMESASLLDSCFPLLRSSGPARAPAAVRPTRPLRARAFTPSPHALRPPGPCA
jgi:hypothetical protein